MPSSPGTNTCSTVSSNSISVMYQAGEHSGAQQAWSAEGEETAGVRAGVGGSRRWQRPHLKSPPGTESVGSCEASSVGFSFLEKPAHTCRAATGAHEGALKRRRSTGGSGGSAQQSPDHCAM